MSNDLIIGDRYPLAAVAIKALDLAWLGYRGHLAPVTHFSEENAEKLRKFLWLSIGSLGISSPQLQASLPVALKITCKCNEIRCLRPAADGATLGLSSDDISK